MAAATPPKLFVSYSWSNADHEAWVLALAVSLVESGVEVLLDKWQLRDGHEKGAREGPSSSSSTLSGEAQRIPALAVATAAVRPRNSRKTGAIRSR